GVDVSSRALLTAVGLPWPRRPRKEKPAAPMLVTTVPQMTQTLKPRFSAKTEKLRFFLAVRFPPDSQNSVLSGFQWSSQRPRFWCVNAGDSECWPVAAAVAVIGVLSMPRNSVESNVGAGCCVAMSACDVPAKNLSHRGIARGAVLVT